jgi:glycosyltransferase involved in cell wall biosynthesis
MKRILDEERCGITFKDRDPHDLARAIVEVYNSGFDYGGNGKKAVRGKYNWQEDEIRLIEVLQKCH